jgi:nicotinamide-nucleotide amidase
MALTDQELRDMADQLGDCMKARGKSLAAAESCTGGWLAKIITDIPGSSAWFVGSVVSYSNEAKQNLLGVRADTLTEFGAVSGETVLEMTEGVFAHTDADVAVSISGIAGPDGGTVDKPVGLVWLCWGKRGKGMFANHYHFEGGRDEVRRQSVQQALENLSDLLIC